MEVDFIVNDYDFIFLATDRRLVVDKFKEIFEHSILQLRVTPQTQLFLVFKSSTVGGYKMAEDTLIDAYLLSKTDFLIKTNSNLSNFSLLANSNLKFKRI